MPHFLFVVEIPPIPPSVHGATVAPAWQQFCSEVDTTIKLPKACKQLQKNVWLLPAENALPALLALSSTAEKHTLAYSALLVENVIDLDGKISAGMQRVPLSGV
jgi:hypothetical protein